MKCFTTIAILSLLTLGCSKPFSGSEITANNKVVDEPNLIKIDVSQVETPTTETTDSTEIIEETIDITSNLTLPTESTTVSTQVITEPVVESINPPQAEVNQNQESLSQISEVAQPQSTVENQPVVSVVESEPQVLTNVVYIAEELTKPEAQEESEIDAAVVEPLPSIAEMLPTPEPIDITEPFVVDDALKEELDKAIFNDAASEVTVVSYQKKDGSFEEYSIYTQNVKDLSLVKEFSVFVKDGKVQLIQSLNNKNIESFSTELNEIVSLEKKFKEKLESEEVDSIKESTVAQFVKNKKDKKTSKIKNKKFGKKSKRNKRH
jgi:hypothetical protein